MIFDQFLGSTARGLSSLLAITIVTCLTALLLREWRSSLRRIPGPLFARISNFYLFTNALRGNMHVLFGQLHRKYGNIVRVGPNKVSIADPTLLPVIYGISSNYPKSPFYDTFTSNYQGSRLDNVFATRDPAWHKNMKSAVASTYSLSYLRQFEPLVDECCRLFIDGMLDLAGQPLDLGEWLQWYAFDVIGNITFSRTFGMLKNRADRRNVIAGLKKGNGYNTAVGQIEGMHSYLLGNARLTEYTAKVPALAEGNPLTVLNEMGRDALKAASLEDDKMNNSSGQDYLHFLRRVQIEKPGRLSDREVWSALMTNMFAGSDTTGIALRAIFYYLAKDRNRYDRLRDEIDQAEASGKFSEYVTFEQGMDLSYLQAVIKEAMRLHPAVSYPLERVVPAGGAEMCGHYLPAGTIVGMHAWVIHRNQTIFGQDAEDFRPERWLSGDATKVKAMDQHLMTFGGGNRTCLGKNISMLEMTKFVPQILRVFDFEWAMEQGDWTISGYWFAHQRGLMMRLVPKTIRKAQ
ncbi:Cytochrome p-450 [Cladophialophora chaetospira]|uniref:Cytochrome p-450 n=1 Tax=Cladophialophora chaetospira TaxID=386627 RepID=A0AA38X499_9EURO|nr:Cytochrome p-450 [Cladophialophora chaetospira]